MPGHLPCPEITADSRLMRYCLKQDPRLLEEVGDLSVYLTEKRCKMEASLIPI